MCSNDMAGPACTGTKMVVRSERIRAGIDGPLTGDREGGR